MKDRQASSLHFAVRPKVLLKFLGQLLIVIGVLYIIPLLFAFVTGDYSIALPYGIIISSTLVPGFLLQKITVQAEIQKNEVFVISSLIFLIAAALGAIPFRFAGLSWIDAFFEAVSGVTTTGLSTVPTLAGMPDTFLFSRAWLQWIGGLGIVVVSIAILLPQSRTTLNLFEENWEREGIVAGTKKFARIILRIYLLLTLVGILLLLISGVNWLDAMVHIFAAVSTGGFSSYNNSLAGLNSRTAQSIVTLVSILGAIPFILLYMIPKLELRKFFGNEELRAFIAMIALASAATAASFVFADGKNIVDAVLLATSAQTTTGFSSVAVSELSVVSKSVLLPVMLIGGSVGSTAGGIKIMRLLIVLTMIRFLVVRTGLPADAVIHPRLKDRRLEETEIQRCCILVMLFFLVISISWFCFIFMGYPVLDSLFEVVSATCTVGLSSGISSPDLPPVLKSVLCIDMLLGRLEIMAFLVLLYPPTWYGKQRGV